MIKCDYSCIPWLTGITMFSSISMVTISHDVNVANNNYMHSECARIKDRWKPCIYSSSYCCQLYITLSNGKPTLIASLGKLSSLGNSTELDIVAIDPTKGNVSLLYKLPSLYGLNSNIWVCLRVDSKKNLIHVLVNDADLTVEQSFLYELNLADGRLMNTYNISRNRFGMSELYTQWNFDPDTKILYGLCLNVTNTTIHWNYT